MIRLIAEDLLLLCFDHTHGRSSSPCNATLPVAMGGALMLDLMWTQAVIVSGERVRPSGRRLENALLADALAGLVDRRPRPKMREAVEMLGTPNWFTKTRNHMVYSGLLLAEPCFFLGLFPMIRYRAADIERVNSIRKAIITLLTGDGEPQEARSREVVLAALAGSAKVIDTLINPAEHKKARERAATFVDSQSVCQAVHDVIDAQLHAIRFEAVAAGMGGVIVVGSCNPEQRS